MVLNKFVKLWKNFPLWYSIMDMMKFFFIFTYLCFLNLFFVISGYADSVASQASLSIKKGQVLLINEDISTLQLDNCEIIFKCRDKDYPFFIENKKLFSYVSVGFYFQEKSFFCDMSISKKNSSTNNSEIILSKKFLFNVIEGDYKKSYIKVDEKHVVLSPEDQKRADQEREMLSKIYLDSPNQPFFKTNFSLPIKKKPVKVTSAYGTTRIFNNQKESNHLGIDFRSRVGNKIFVANDGIVVFVGDLFYSGTSVIVSHGLGIYSTYLHLSKALVKKDDVVRKGSLLALSGMSGRSSGPHLHWGVKIDGDWINGMDLVNLDRSH